MRKLGLFGWRRLWTDFIATFQYLKGPTGKLKRDFLSGTIVVGQGLLLLTEKGDIYARDTDKILCCEH